MFKHSVAEVLFFTALTQQSDHFMQQISVAAAYTYRFFKEEFYCKLIIRLELLDDSSCCHYCSYYSYEIIAQLLYMYYISVM
jgi:hypothetical protein